MTGRTSALGALWLAGIVAAYFSGKASSPSEPALTDRTAATAPETIRGKAPLPPPESFERQLPNLDDPRTHDQLLDIADQWGADAPEEAVAWLHHLDFDDSRNPFLFAALTPWAALDPDAATAWIDDKHPTGTPQRDYLLAALIRGISRTDPNRAARLLLAAPPGPERTGALDFIVGAWSQISPQHAFENIENLPTTEPDLRLRAIAKAIGHLPELDVAKAWADTLAEPTEKQTALTAIAANWSQSDPPAAAEWAGKLTDPPTRARALAEVATRWARIDPLTSDLWLDQHTDAPDFDLARRRYAGNTVSYDPATAFAHLANISARPLRHESFEQIGRIFVSQRPVQARTYLTSTDTPIPAPIRELLLDLYAE